MDNLGHNGMSLEDDIWMQVKEKRKPELLLRASLNA